MSFSSEVKQELCLLKPDKPCCALSELCGLFMTMGSLNLLGRGKLSVSFTNESLGICRRVYTLLSQFLRLVPQIHYVTNKRFGGTRKYILTLGPTQSPPFLCALHMMQQDAQGTQTLLSTAPKLPLSRFCCMRAFLRGVMLGGGTMSNPDQSYHLELPCQDEEQRVLMEKCFRKLDLPIKRGQRRGHLFYYFKQSEQVVTLLSAVGANQALMQVENLRVKKQVLSTVNRALNCDTANLEKQMVCSEDQMTVIRQLQEEGALENLSPSLKEIALARLDAPDATLTQLGQALVPPLGKSGVNHRMRRLMAFADANLSAEKTPVPIQNLQEAETK
ncbi:MAG: DNA-binding protein WhiA [Clostridia bacterium]